MLGIVLTNLLHLKTIFPEYLSLQHTDNKKDKYSCNSSTTKWLYMINYDDMGHVNMEWVYKTCTVCEEKWSVWERCRLNRARGSLGIKLCTEPHKQTTTQWPQTQKERSSRQQTFGDTKIQKCLFPDKNCEHRQIHSTEYLWRRIQHSVYNQMISLRHEIIDKPN